jgi:RNA polymerase sigma-70 factor (ECF subfamily)
MQRAGTTTLFVPGAQPKAESEPAPLGEGSETVVLPGGYRQWTRAVAAGDEAAFNQFFDAFSARLFRLVLLITRGDEHLAREIHQISMIKAARKFKAFDSEPELWSWLSRIARNAFVDHVRKENFVSRIRPESVGESGTIEPAGSTVILEWLDEAVSALRPEDRQLIESIYTLQKSQNEIAGQTGWSRKAVESRVSRIRQRLRKLLLRKADHEKEV